MPTACATHNRRRCRWGRAGRRGGRVTKILGSIDRGTSSQYDSCTKRCTGSVATSLKIPDRRIGRADGQDCANLGHFAKNPSSFIEINPQSTKFCIFSTKLLEPNWNQPAVPLPHEPAVMPSTASRTRRRAPRLLLRPPTSTLHLHPRPPPHRWGLRLIMTSRHLASPPSRPPPTDPGSPSELAGSLCSSFARHPSVQRLWRGCTRPTRRWPQARTVRSKPRHGDSHESEEPSACRSARLPASTLHLTPRAPPCRSGIRLGCDVSAPRQPAVASSILNKRQTKASTWVSWSFFNARSTTRAEQLGTLPLLQL